MMGSETLPSITTSCQRLEAEAARPSPSLLHIMMVGIHHCLIPPSLLGPTIPARGRHPSLLHHVQVPDEGLLDGGQPLDLVVAAPDCAGLELLPEACNLLVAGVGGDPVLDAILAGVDATADGLHEAGQLALDHLLGLAEGVLERKCWGSLQ